MATAWAVSTIFHHVSLLALSVGTDLGLHPVELPVLFVLDLVARVLELKIGPVHVPGFESVVRISAERGYKPVHNVVEFGSVLWANFFLNFCVGGFEPALEIRFSFIASGLWRVFLWLLGGRIWRFFELELFIAIVLPC